MNTGDHFILEGMTLTVITGKRKGSKYTVKKFDPITFTITVEDPWYVRLWNKVVHFIIPLWEPKSGSTIKTRPAFSDSEPEHGNDPVEQLRVQLAGCSVAALGGTKDPAKKGQYGWSPAYQDVLELRRAYDDLQARYKEMRKNLLIFHGLWY